MRLVVDGWAEDPEASRQKAIAFAQRALGAATDDPVVLANAAYTLAYFGEDMAAMTGLADQALALNPSYARGWFVSGILRLFAGQPDLAIEHVERSLRLSPRGYPGLTPMTVIGMAHLLSRRFELAAQNLRLGLRQTPDWPSPYRYLAACYAHLGRLDEARASIEQLRVMGAPMVPRQAFPNRELHELLISGLRLATGEDT
jgi:adenylate cyclase